MRQVLQHARSGEITVENVPAPQLLPGCALVRVAASLVSAGTERASAEFARKNLLQKAQARPDLVRDVISKVQRDGLFSAMQAVRSRLDQPQSPGYSSAGTVIAVGEGVSDLQPGDRVACAGAGFAVHAEIACVPRLLLARIPYRETGNDVPFDEAAFATLGAVALHGIRTAEVKLGDTVALIGLGLLGQLTLQLLKAAGGRVIGMDINPARAELARQMGADSVATDPSSFQLTCLENTRGLGADSVVITAETSSSEPVNLAGAVARDRAIVVAVGTVGIDIERKAFYEKELDFRISRSYGPGRYDAAFEQKGRDYPIGYVRWTETRNMEAFVQLLAEGKVRVAPLITHRFSIESAYSAYQLITGKKSEPFLGVVIQYPGTEDVKRTLLIVPRSEQFASLKANSTRVRVGLLGAGMFASNTLIPAMKESPETDLVSVCAANGSHASAAAKKFGFDSCTTDESEIIGSSDVNTIVIATRHHLHAAQVLAGISAGKHVFCEKPLCLSEEQLSEIVQAWNGLHASQPPVLMVGFNRRFAPMTLKLKQFLSEISEPLALQYRINAGYLSPDHWSNDPEQGGGRILGEVCHFVDLLAHLAGSPVLEVEARLVGRGDRYSRDNVIISLRFASGSEGTISYLANGDRSFSKERIEIFGGGSVAVLEDFRELQLVRNGHKEILRSRWRQDKGHRDEWLAFVHAVQQKSELPVPFDQIVATTLATLRIDQSIASGSRLPVNAAGILDNPMSKLRANSNLNA